MAKVGRRGRIFIHESGKRRIFYFKASKWQNPFAVGQGSHESACKKFKKALLDGSLKDPKAGTVENW